MPAENEPAQTICQIRKVVDRARNEKQKSVLLKEAAQMSQDRSLRAQATSRKLCAEVAKARSGRKRA